MNNSPCDNEQLVGKQPSTNTIAHLVCPLQATEPKVARAQKTSAQIIQNLISSSAQNTKRIGNHAILTDRMLGKGHYGIVYLGYELPTAGNKTATAPSKFTPMSETKVVGSKPQVDLTSLKAGSAGRERSHELLACKTI